MKEKEELLTAGYIYARPVVFAPDKKEEVITQTNGTIVRSMDNGKDWQYGGSGYTGARLKNIKFISEKEMMFALTDYGIFYTKCSGIYFVDLKPRLDFSNEKSSNAVDVSGNIVVATLGAWTKKYIIRSVDYGKSWEPVALPTATDKDDYAEPDQDGHVFSFLKFNSENDEVVYADKWISRSKGEADSWVMIGQDWQYLLEEEERIAKDFEIRAMHPEKGDLICGFVVIEDRKNVVNEDENGKFWWQMGCSEDAGDTWTAVGDRVSFGYDKTKDLTDVAIDPFTEDDSSKDEPFSNLRVYATSPRGLFEYNNKDSENGEWTQRTKLDENGDNSDDNIMFVWKDLFTSVEFDPNRPGVIWTAKRALDGKHGNGVYVSLDNGQKWHNVINNLGPYNDFYNIEISPFDSKVFLTGPGIWTYTPPWEDGIATSTDTDGDGEQPISR
jgi:photosystem II stability/assembly factor-like uncharacterized protein